MKQAKVIKLPASTIKKVPEKCAVAEDPVIYHAILTKNPLSQKAYERLMIIYRKLKEYKKELDIINSGIKAFEAFYNSHKKSPDKKVHSISRQLNRSLGLTDKKGKMLFDHQPVSTWKKRKENLLKRIKGMKGRNEL